MSAESSEMPPAMDVSPETAACYRRALETLQAAQVPFLVGGAFAFGFYTGISRHTKDFDLFLRPRDSREALTVLAGAGYRTELTSPIWIGKAFCGDDFLDLIFNGGNGIATVDDGWFAHARPGTVLDVAVQLCPPEEMIWSKAFVMDRYRYDGADVAHLLRACGRDLDWTRLVERFAGHWPVLLTHLLLFSYIYPADRDLLPAPLLQDLLTRAQAEVGTPGPDIPLCRGPLFSRTQYTVDLERDGYQDGRVAPWGKLTAPAAAELTAEEREGK